MDLCWVRHSRALLENTLKGTKDQPAQAISLFITVIAQVTAVLILRFRLALILCLPVAPAFLLSTSPVMSCDVQVALASDHAPFVILTVLQTEALEFVPRGIRITYC